MSAAVETRFKAQLQKMPEPKRWLIGHSGGLDSQVLLHLAAKTLPSGRLLVVHVNHHLQKPADSWSEFSARQAKQYGLNHIVVDVFPDSGSEDAARRARYGAFQSLMATGDCLLLGHHGDDQVETLLFRLVRGSGLKGLAGMPKTRALPPGRLSRPLLGLQRTELEVYAEEQGLDWIEDPSNESDEYSRNFLRLNVLPLLEKRWPGFRQRAVAVSAQLGASQQVLEEYLDQDLKSLVGAFGELRFENMEGYSSQRYSHVLRRWVEQASGLLLNDKQLREIKRALIDAREDAQPQLRLRNMVVRRYQRALYLSGADVCESAELDCLTVGVYPLGDGRLFVEPAEAGLKTLQGVRLERRQGGERCRPVGRGGSCSVKKLLQEAGIPPWLKAHWPLLKSGEEIIAVPGICVCEGWYTKSDGFSVSWHSFALSKSRSFGIL